MLTKGDSNWAKFVTKSFEVYESLEKDLFFAEPFSEKEITTIPGTLYVCRGAIGRKHNPVQSSLCCFACFRLFRVCLAFHYQRSFELRKTFGSLSHKFETSLSLIKLNGCSGVGVLSCLWSQPSLYRVRFRMKAIKTVLVNFIPF